MTIKLCFFKDYFLYSEINAPIEILNQALKETEDIKKTSANRKVEITSSSTAKVEAEVEKARGKIRIYKVTLTDVTDKEYKKQLDKIGVLFRRRLCEPSLFIEALHIYPIIFLSNC